jgi:hypothetical protein
MAENTSSPIIGDVTVAPVTLNNKGGSLTAILQRAIRGALAADIGGVGAKLVFDSGISCLLVVPAVLDPAGKHDMRVRVTRVMENRFVVDLEDEKGVKSDPMVSYILSLIEEFAQTRKILPVSGEDAADELLQIAAEGREEIEAIKADRGHLKPK